MLTSALSLVLWGFRLLGEPCGITLHFRPLKVASLFTLRSVFLSFDRCLIQFISYDFQPLLLCIKLLLLGERLCYDLLRFCVIELELCKVILRSLNSAVDVVEDSFKTVQVMGKTLDQLRGMRGGTLQTSGHTASHHVAVHRDRQVKALERADLNGSIRIFDSQHSIFKSFCSFFSVSVLCLTNGDLEYRQFAFRINRELAECFTVSMFKRYFLKLDNDKEDTL